MHLPRARRLQQKTQNYWISRISRLHQCQIDGWKKHKVACKRARKRKKLDYSKEKCLVGELLSVAMRGGGHKGVLGTILSYV